MLKIISLALVLPSCQKPVAQAPVYNFTFTDQSSIIVGDNNSPVIAPETDNDQRAESVATAEAKPGNLKAALAVWLIVWLLVFAGYYAWRRGWIK